MDENGLVKALRRTFVRLRDLQPLTALGLVVGGGGLAVHLLVGRGSSDFVLFAAGAAALALTGLASLLVVLGSLLLVRRLRRAPSALPPVMETGSVLRTGFRFRGLGRWPLVTVSVGWLRPRAVRVRWIREGGDLVEVARPTRRGRYPEILRTVTVGDIFGLASITFRSSRRSAVQILPALGRGRVELILRSQGGEAFSHPDGKPVGDYIEMRRYQPGDPLRHILWKTFARSRRLLVRSPERAVAPEPSTAAYLIAGPGDEPAASTARAFLEWGLLGEAWAFSADGAPGLARDVADAVDQIVGSADYRDRGGEGLDGFLRKVDRSMLDNCVIFAPGRSGPWESALSAFARKLPRPPRVILAVDEVVVPPQPRRRLLGWIWRPPDAPGGRFLRDLVDLHDGLSRQGMEVTLLHRPTGKVVGPERIRVLREAVA